jgi:hypothetical protein
MKKSTEPGMQYIGEGKAECVQGTHCTLSMFNKNNNEVALNWAETKNKMRFGIVARPYKLLQPPPFRFCQPARPQPNLDRRAVVGEAAGKSPMSFSFYSGFQNAGQWLWLWVVGTGPDSLIRSTV